MTDDQLFELLGLSDENERAKKSAQVDESNNVLELNGHAVIEGTDGAAIPVDDAIPGEVVILYDKNNPCMDKGTMYPSLKEFRLVVRQFVIKKEFELAIEKSDPERYRVTVHNEDHGCTSTMRIKTTTPSQAWVADKAIDILNTNPNMGPKALWKEEVLKRSPGSIVEIDIKEVDGRPYFHRFFCALSPCIEGFVDGCRPYLSIDSTALNGKWNGHLASATSINGHNWMYPVAFGFIDSESEDNWVWFMTQLHKAIGDLEPLAICSDECKGLENVVQKVFHKAEQRECFFHLMKNFAKRFHGDTFGNMYPAARAYRSVVFQKHMTPIINGSPEVWKWLTTYHKLKWMRCGFNPEIKCDYFTNNIAEVFNNWIRDYKDLHVVDLADKIRETILILWDKRRRIGERLHGRILPAVMHQLKGRTRGLGYMNVPQRCQTRTLEGMLFQPQHKLAHVKSGSTPANLLGMHYPS
nr:uncharacterized protein LOC107280873 [Oryza sativa Japonica Group]